MTDFQLSNEYIQLICQSKGGEMTSIKDKDGLEYLWQSDSAYWGGQAPVLFPICGSLRNNQAQLSDGQTISMPRHGIARKQEFQGQQISQTQLRFTLQDTPQLYEQFPFHFQLEVDYCLEGHQIIVTYTVSNLDRRRMPYFIGGHPAFNCPLLEGEDYSDYAIEFEKEETIESPSILPNGLLDFEHKVKWGDGSRILNLSHQLFYRDAIILDDIQSRSVRLISKNHEKGFKLDFPDYPFLLLWSSDNDGPFIALEPWSGLSMRTDESDQFEDRRDVRFLEPNEQATYQFMITIN